MARRFTLPPTDDLKNYNVTDPASSVATSADIVDNYGSVVITTTGAGNAQTIASPTDTTQTARFTVMNNDSSTNSIVINGTTLEAGEAEQWIWEGTAWVVDGIAGTTAPFATASNVTSNSPGTLATDDFVFGSDSLDDDGNLNHDSRMFFDKSEGAFRAGGVRSTQWDSSNVGLKSFACGFDTTASGAQSFACGYSTLASGNYSFASGYNTTASGDYSFAYGQNFRNAQRKSLAVGHGTGVSDDTGVAIRLEADADQDDTKKKAIYFGDTTAPATTTNRLYSVGGALNWNGIDLTAGGGLTWGDSITDTSGVAVTATLGATSASGTQGFYTLLNNTQSNALVPNKIDLGTSAQGHTGLLINAKGVSTSQRGIVVDLGTSGTGVAYYASASVNGGDDGALYGGAMGGNYKGSAFEVQPSIAGDVSAASIEIGRRMGSPSLSMMSDFSITYSGSAGSRSTDFSNTGLSRTQSGGFTSNDDYNLHKFTRTTITTNAGAIFNAQGSVIHAENVVTQTAGTLTDTVSVLKLTQDNDSTGGHILFNSYSGTPTTDGTLYFDGTSLKIRSTTTQSFITDTATQTLTNKTLTASTNVLGGITMTLGSDADGDIYYRTSNVLTRLAKGTAAQVLTMNAGATAPEWADAGGGGLTWGTSITSSANETAEGLTLTLDNTQDNAEEVLVLNLGTSTQSHVGNKVIMTGASTGQRGFEVNTSTTGTGSCYEASGGTANSLLIGSNIPSPNDSRIIIGTFSEGSATSARSSEYVRFTGQTYIGAAITISDNYDFSYLARTNRVNNAGGTLNSSGSVMKLENIATQSAGTLVDSVAVLELTQDNDSTGGHILFNSYSGTPTTDGTFYFDGTSLKIRASSATQNLATQTGINSIKESFSIAISDETTAITTGTAKATFRMPYAFTLTAVRASLSTASSSGLPAFNIKEGGTTILSTTITIDATEKTSTTATTPAVISDTSLADDAEITIDVDTAGTGAKGAKITLIGYKT